MESATLASGGAAAVRHLLATHLPRGNTLPPEAWASRHRKVLMLLWAHVPVLAGFGFWMGLDPFHVVPEVGLVAAAAVASGRLRASRSVVGTMASAGLLTCSALLTHFSGGYIEAHFHFFVMIIVISLYQEWMPFLLSVGYVMVHHGVVGVLEPASVFNHPAAIADPWTWAGIHAVFVLAASVASIVNWRLNERARDQAERAERRLRTVVTGAPVVLLAADRGGRLTLLEGQGLSTLGLVPERDLGRPVASVFPSAPELLDAVRRALGGEEVTAPAAVDNRTLEVRCSPLTGHGGEVEGVIGVATDVTDRRRAEDAERAAREQMLAGLRETDRLKTSLLNTAAHELNTPLTPIKLQLHLLRTRKGGGLSPEQVAAVDVLDRNFDRLGRIIQDVLEVGRLEAGQLRVEKQEVDIDSLVRDAAEAFGPAAREAGLTLEVASARGLVVSGDAHRLSQVLFNLLSNALKFTPRGGQVRLEAAAAGPEAVVRVRDTGVGLGKGELERLFQPFTQLREDRERAPGTGLGLYISQGIAELHDGRIWAESEGPGRGSTFTLALPLRAAAPPPRPPASG